MQHPTSCRTHHNLLLSHEGSLTTHCQSFLVTPGSQTSHFAHTPHTCTHQKPSLLVVTPQSTRVLERCYKPQPRYSSRSALL